MLYEVLSNPTVLSSSSDKTMKVWDCSARQCLYTLKEHTDQVCISVQVCVCVSSTVLTISHFSSGVCARFPQVWDIAVNSVGTKLVSVSDDKSIHVYSCPLP